MKNIGQYLTQDDLARLQAHQVKLDARRTARDTHPVINPDRIVIRVSGPTAIVTAL